MTVRRTDHQGHGRGTLLRALIAGAALLLATAGISPAAHAQTPADTAGLVRAVAGVVGDSLLPHLRVGRQPLLGEPATPFDWSVTLHLRDAHSLTLMPAQAETAEWVVTRGVTVRGDTAAVLVEVGTRTLPRRAIDTYIETNRYWFVRTPAGWEFVRREFVSGADLGAVRG